MKPIDPRNDEMMTTLGTVYLDGSHPDVPPYLAAQFKQMVEDYKPTFMKWDHHYGSLEEGPRYDPTMTGLQAHNKAVRMIRAALPEDLVVTRSMGWLFGAIECYDAVRIGNDINHPGVKREAEPYANMTYGKTARRRRITISITTSLSTIPTPFSPRRNIRWRRRAAISPWKR